MPDLIYAADDHMMLKALSQKALTEIQNIDRLLFDLRNAFFEQSKVKDPKLARLKELLRDHSSKDRRILVFSRFTSTTSAIIDELEEFVDRVGVGRFDGECARIYRIASDKVEYDDCSRGDIVEALQKGRIGILVSSDAASEGLNLHAANVVINVDVPWNPSRLLQRFGRVDRLGQVAEDVYLINLYYPNSIEERMYSVLEARRTDFRAVLGEVPEIMSDQQKRVVTALSAGKRPKINLTLQMIENERRLYQQNSMLIDSSTADDTSLNVEKIYKNLIETLKEAADKLGRSIVEKGDLSIEINGESICLDPLGCEFIGFCHLDLSHLETSRKESGVLADLHQLIDSQGNPICLSIIDENHIIPVPAKHWMKMFEFLFIGRAIDISDMKRYSIESIGELLSDLRSNESWIWPDLNQMKCLSSLMPATPNIGELKIGSSIGKVLLRP
ncbi:MAG: helicase-related protein [Candidatus Thorarchaeota archaeon]